MKVICWILRVVGGGPNGVGLCNWRLMMSLESLGFRNVTRYTTDYCHRQYMHCYT